MSKKNNLKVSDLFLNHQWPVNVQAELFILAQEKRSLAWGEGKPQIQSMSSTEGASLRLIKEGRQALCTTTCFDAESWGAWTQQALTLLEKSPIDLHRSLPAAQRSTQPIVPVDQEIFSLSSLQWLDHLAMLEKLILGVDPVIKQVTKLQLFETRQKKTVLNTNGIQGETLITQSGVMGEVLAQQGTSTEAAWDVQQNRFLSHLTLDSWALELGAQAATSLGGKPISSGAIAVVLHPRVGNSLLDLALDALSAEAVQMGRSYFVGKKGHSVFSPLLTVCDDPLKDDGVATELYDDEGVPRQKRTVVEAGVLSDYFYDTKTANKEGRLSNGSATKKGLEALPHPAPSNAFIQAGVTPEKDLLRLAPRVFMIHDVMGLHMADPATGEFSLGASGFLYENGECVHAVKGVTMAGQLLTFFKRVSAVGNQIHWQGSTGVPYFFIPEVMVAGH